MKPIRITALGAAVAALLVAQTFAQEVRREAGEQPGQPRPGAAREGQRPGQPPGQPARPLAGAQQGIDDSTLAAWLIIDNQAEIALGELAQQRSQNDNVRQFAQRIVRDHQQFVQRLQSAAGPAGAGLRVQPGAARQPAQPGRERTEADREQRDDVQTARTQPAEDDDAERVAGFRPGQEGSRAQNVIELKQQLGQQHIASLREELGRKEGAEFDKAFVGAMVHDHLKMTDTLQVFGRNASPQLRETLAEGLQTTREHLQMARQLKEQLDRSPGPQAGQRQQQRQQRQQQRQQPGTERPE